MENTPQFINEKTGQPIKFPPNSWETLLVRYLPEPNYSEYYKLMWYSDRAGQFFTSNSDHLTLPREAEITGFILVKELDKGWNIPAPHPKVNKSLSLEERLIRYGVSKPATLATDVMGYALRGVLTSVAQNRNGIHSLEKALLIRDFLKEFPEVFEEKNMNKIIKVLPWYTIFFDAWESFDLAVTAREKKGEAIEESNPSCKGLVDFIDAIDAEMHQVCSVFQKLRAIEEQ